MGLDDALIFTRVVECHSFTLAAAGLGMQKSTVSRRIAQLEERLGVRLLNRTTRKLRLTEVGQAYYERCRQIMLDFAEAEQADVEAGVAELLGVGGRRVAVVDDTVGRGHRMRPGGVETYQWPSAPPTPHGPTHESQRSRQAPGLVRST